MAASAALERRLVDGEYRRTAFVRAYSDLIMKAISSIKHASAEDRKARFA
jgi:hypothetical protein